MKRRVYALLLAILLLNLLLLPVAASQAQLDYVTDEAGLLTASQRKYLENRAAEISGTYRIGVYIVILPDYLDYDGAGDFESFSMDYFDEHSLGFGEDNAGIMLLLSMAERDYDLDVNSIRARGIFTEPALDDLEDAFLPDFRRDNFYSGFSNYLTKCEKIMIRGERENSIGYISNPDDAMGIDTNSGIFLPQGYIGGADGPTGIVVYQRVNGEMLLIASIIGAVAALLMGLLLCSPMKSAKQKRDADQYVARGGLNLRRRSDMFLHRTVSRRPRQSESSNHHPSGGAHHPSGGSHHYSSGSHSGRSGKF